MLGSLGDQSVTVRQRHRLAVRDLLATLATASRTCSNGIAYANEAAASVSRSARAGPPAAAKIVHEADRTASTVLADRDYFDNLLNTLPDAYQKLNRQGLYGDFFSFYLCDLILKLNGKGGQPVYVKVAGQDLGRCTPR